MTSSLGSFTDRVNFAAAVISSGRKQTRNFDNCFEMYDGDAVSAALMRRAQKNPRLAANMPRYLSMELCEQNFKEYEGQDLKQVSAALIAKAIAARET